LLNVKYVTTWRETLNVPSEVLALAYAQVVIVVSVRQSRRTSDMPAASRQPVVSGDS